MSLTVVFRRARSALWPASAATTKKRSPSYVGPLPPSLTSPILMARLPAVAPVSSGCTTGNARILYEVDDEALVIYIINIVHIS